MQREWGCGAIWGDMSILSGTIHSFKLVKCHTASQTPSASLILGALYMVCFLGKSCESSCHQTNASNLSKTDMGETVWQLPSTLNHFFPMLAPFPIYTCALILSTFMVIMSSPACLPKWCWAPPDQAHVSCPSAPMCLTLGTCMINASWINIGFNGGTSGDEPAC